MLRRLMAPKLFPLLDALVVFYLLDQVRLVAATIPLLSRALLAAELLGAVIVLAYQGRQAARRRARFFLLLSVPAFAFMASMLGYVNLATLLGEAVLGSAYAAVLLYSLVKVLEVLVMLALHQPPLIWLSAVRQYRGLIWQRTSWILQGAAWLSWALITLERMALRAPAVDSFRKILSATLTVGSLSLSLGNVLAFVFTVWASFQVSRLVRFLLNEDIYPRLHLAAGLPYAISMVLHYTILVVGFLTATAVLGVDMTKFTILASAFGVGMGFGMQSIVNNFMSGLILLFERPVKVGDVIQVEDAEGQVETIGIRATTVRTSSGSRVIVPNGSLLAGRVTNWTGSSRDRKIELQVAVDCGANPADVMALLESVASEHPSISKSPRPQALFVKQGAGALNFELDAWTDQPARGVQFRSELALAVNAALTRAKVPIR
jgi:small-conductance mechanosensitive channel